MVHQCLCLTTVLILSRAIALVSGRIDNIFEDETNLAATLEAIQNARESIINVTNLFWQANQTNLSAKFLRLAFHDSIGGMDGCVDLSNLDNFGMDIPIDALKPIVKQYATPESGLSRADIWALAGLTGVETSQSGSFFLEFPLQFVGRRDCENSEKNEVCRNAQKEIVACSYKTGPYRHMPSSHLDTAELLHFFRDTFDFSARETVIIMGAHTLGFAKREHSGFDGPVGWVRDPHRFNNEYYRMLVGGGNCISEFIDEAPNWSRETMRNSDLVLPDNTTMPDRFVWTRRSDDSIRDSSALIMTSSDMALVRNFTGRVTKSTDKVECNFKNSNACPYAKSTGFLMAEYRNDNRKFIRDFRDTFNLMITRGYITTSTDVPSDCMNCLTQVDFSITSSPTFTPSTQPSVLPSIQPTEAPPSHGHSPTGIDLPNPSATISGGHMLWLATTSLCSIFILL